MAALLFENRHGERRQIADCETWQEVNKAIDNFIAQANAQRFSNRAFERYYTRTGEENGATKIDVGSHTEFFFWEKLIDNEITDRNW